MKYTPKRDMVYALIIWGNLIVLLPFLIVFFTVEGFAVYLIILCISYLRWDSTEYRIEKGELIVKCWMCKKKIRIQDIKSVKRTNNIYSSFALSSDRLEITEESNKKFYAAPQDFKSFIKELRSINDNIFVNEW